MQATQKGFVGFSMYVMWPVPYTDSEEDAVAAERVNDFLIGW